MITADEEVGGGLGAHWLCEQHPDKVRSDFVVNEGGGELVEFGGRRLYTLSVGEKGIFRMKLRDPRPGRPRLAAADRRQRPAQARRLPRGALRAAAAGADRRSARRCSRRCSASPSPARRASGPGWSALRAEQPLLADYLVEPMLGVTLTPTMAQAGKKANVIPSEAEALIDCRVPPGVGRGGGAATGSRR